jgi:cytochrome c oxidase subunit 1
MAIGAIMTNVAIFQGESSVMFTSYVPMQAKPHFYLGLILFAVGALIGCFVFLGTLVVAKAEKTYEGSIPLVTFGALTAAIIAIFTIASGAIILIPTFLWSLGYIREIDTHHVSRRLVGDGPQLAADQRLRPRRHLVRRRCHRLRRQADVREGEPLGLPALHPVPAARQRAPSAGPTRASAPSWKMVNTSYFMYFAVLASMIHGMTIPGAIEQAQRAKGYNKGLFEWLRKAPWGNPAFSAVFLSLVGFGFLGGISGVMMGTEQLNLLIHNTIYVPGHFHATVVIGTTLAFMGLTYFLVPVLFKREVLFPGFAKLQPYLFGLSMYVVALVMMGAGTLGVSRRHWDMAFAGSGMAYEWPGAAYLMMGLTGIFGVIAIIGGAGWILQVVLSLLFGKKLDDGETRSTPIPLTLPPQTGGHAAHVATPGTMVLALVFLVSFILYYFVNWKYLSSLWGMA